MGLRWAGSVSPVPLELKERSLGERSWRVWARWHSAGGSEVCGPDRLSPGARSVGQGGQGGGGGVSARRPPTEGQSKARPGRGEEGAGGSHFRRRAPPPRRDTCYRPGTTAQSWCL